jgi:putative oxidoreductase
MNKVLFTRGFPALIIRLAVGLIFLSEGIQKFLYLEILRSGRFSKLGINPPVFWANLTGTFEII